MSNVDKENKVSAAWAQRRMDKAASQLGDKVLNRFLAFARYLLGMETRQIASSVDIPVDTLNGLFKRILRDGPSALEDRRNSNAPSQPGEAKTCCPQTFRINQTPKSIRLSVEGLEIHLDPDDDLQNRVVLLTLLENNLVEALTVAETLGLSDERLRKLKAGFRKGGAAALIDRRQGQVKDYAVPPKMKAELIRNYVERIEQGEPVSVTALKKAIEQMDMSSPSERTLRTHVKKLGLNLIKADECQPARLKKGLRTT